ELQRRIAPFGFQQPGGLGVALLHRQQLSQIEPILPGHVCVQPVLGQRLVQPVDRLRVLLGGDGNIAQPLLDQRQFDAALGCLVQRGGERAAGADEITALLCFLGIVQGTEDRRSDRLLGKQGRRQEQQCPDQHDGSERPRNRLPSRRNYCVLVASRASGWAFARRGAKRQRPAARRASRANTPRGFASVPRRFSTRPSAVMVKARVTSPSIPAASARGG